MLVLLIMPHHHDFPSRTHAVKLNMPVGAPPAPRPVPPEVVTIEVDFDGTLIWERGRVGTGSSRARGAVCARPPKCRWQPEVHLRPNKLVKYERRGDGDGFGAAAGDEKKSD